MNTADNCSLNALAPIQNVRDLRENTERCSVYIIYIYIYVYVLQYTYLHYTYKRCYHEQDYTSRDHDDKKHRGNNIITLLSYMQITI